MQRIGIAALRKRPLVLQVLHLRRGLNDVVNYGIGQLHLVPIAIAVLAGAVFSCGPVREAYVSELEGYLSSAYPTESDQTTFFQIVSALYPHIVFGFVGVALLSYGLYAVHRLLSRVPTRLSDGKAARGGYIGLGLAFAPWVGISWGFRQAASQIERNFSRSAEIAQQLATAGPGTTFSALSAERASWYVIVAGIAVVLLLNKLDRIPRLIVGLFVFAIFLMCAAEFVSTYHYSTEFYRYLGPVATLSLELGFILTIVTFFAYAVKSSPDSNVPIVLLITGIGALIIGKWGFLLSFALCCVMIMAMQIEGWEIAALLALGAWSFYAYHTTDLSIDGPSPKLPSIADSFKAWIEQRQAAPSRQPYPVFIVAAQGGGIYAAVETALILARLQEERPCFADHVFAISGVSGGSVGASLFEAVLNSDRPKFPRCLDRSSLSLAKNSDEIRSGDTNIETLTAKIAKVLSDDYFSPIVGAVVPDFIGTLSGRAATLQESFIASVANRYPVAGQLLSGEYISHWTPEGENPALVLNTTSAETGDRVAFAPFTLEESHTRGLFSFGDPALPQLDVSNQDCRQQYSAPGKVQGAFGQKVPLIFAALASARFPLILPSYALESPCRKVLNFVDGGYADNSGAATAGDLYRAIEHVRTQMKDANFDVKVIVIKSDDPTPNFQDVSGTQLHDLMAPIDAMLAVRRNLGEEAVAHVCDWLQVEDCNAREVVPDNKDWHVKLVRIEDEAFGIPVGWRISLVDIRFISWLIGDPTKCSFNLKQRDTRDGNVTSNIVEEDQDLGGKGGSLDNTTPGGNSQRPTKQPGSDIPSNSCVLKDIENALDQFRS